MDKLKINISELNDTKHYPVVDKLPKEFYKKKLSKSMLRLKRKWIESIAIQTMPVNIKNEMLDRLTNKSQGW